MEPQNTQSPLFCDHANEVPVSCPCDDDCYCKQHTCKPVPVPINDDPVEMYEEAIEQLRKWFSEIYSPAKVDRALHIDQIVVPDSPIRKLYVRAKIWTFTNVYGITASIHVENPPGYLACGAQSRKPRVGETWCRGNDLADGRFSEETWRRILCDIVRYEAEEVKSEVWKNSQITY